MRNGVMSRFFPGSFFQRLSAVATGAQLERRTITQAVGKHYGLRGYWSMTKCCVIIRARARHIYGKAVTRPSGALPPNFRVARDTTRIRTTLSSS
jgi:hypothetical protein